MTNGTTLLFSPQEEEEEEEEEEASPERSEGRATEEDRRKRIKKDNGIYNPTTKEGLRGNTPVILKKAEKSESQPAPTGGRALESLTTERWLETNVINPIARQPVISSSVSQTIICQP